MLGKTEKVVQVEGRMQARQRDRCIKMEELNENGVAPAEMRLDINATRCQTGETERQK